MNKYEGRTKEGHRKTDYHGIPLVIDRPKGFVQKGRDAEGKAWERTYKTDYGFIPRSRGGDGEGLDVFVGPDPTSLRAFWVTQRRGDGNFDEYKLFLGYPTPEAAFDAFVDHIPSRFYGEMRETSVQIIKALRCREPSEPAHPVAGLLGAMRTMASSGWTGLGCDLCGFGSVEDIDRFDPKGPCPDCGTVNLTLDMGVGDVHLPGAGHYRRGPATAPPGTIPMAKLTTHARAALPDSDFALPKDRKYPLKDASHVRNAAARLEEEKKAGKISEGDYGAARRRIASAAKRFGIKSEYNAPSRIRVHASVGSGGYVHVRHMSDAPSWYGPTIELSDETIAEASITLADGEKPKLVWIQLATTGQFAGHPQGPFELNEGIFRQLISNFDASKNHEVPIDFNHCSEQDPTSGSIPERGTPAQGWIKELRVQGAQLMALVEWSALARDYIKEKKYKYISPAIRFGAKDRVTGKPIGARLTSAGLTNQPFLDGMMPMVASDSVKTSAEIATLDDANDKGERTITLAARYAHSPAEYMPHIKNVLGMPELATAGDCSRMLDNLREHFAAAGSDPDGSSGGVPMSGYMRGLRSLVNAPMGSTWDEIFEVVEELIQAAIEEHELKFHGADPDAATSTSSASMEDDIESGEGDVDMDAKETAQTLSDTQGKLTQATTALSDAQTKLSAEQAKTSELTVKLSAAETNASKLETENKALKAQIEERDTKELEAEVDDAIRTYADSKGAKIEMRPHLLSFAKSNRDGFRAMYPKVEADKKHLLADLTGAGAAKDKGAAVNASPDGTVTMSIEALAAKIAEERKIDFASAQVIAFEAAYPKNGAAR